jgi:hypothetical protein
VCTALYKSPYTMYSDVGAELDRTRVRNVQ